MRWALCFLVIWWPESTNSTDVVDIKDGNGIPNFSPLGLIKSDSVTKLGCLLLMASYLYLLPSWDTSSCLIFRRSLSLSISQKTYDLRPLLVSYLLLYKEEMNLMNDLYRKSLSLRKECSSKVEKQGNHTQKQNSERSLLPGISTCWRFSICEASRSIFELWTLKLHTDFSTTAAWMLPLFLLSI